jgi:hypothetical protein
MPPEVNKIAGFSHWRPVQLKRSGIFEMACNYLTSTGAGRNLACKILVFALANVDSGDFRASL